MRIKLIRTIRKPLRLEAWTAMISVAVTIALLLTFLPYRVDISTDGLLSISLNQAQANPDWLSGWTYRKEITVTNAIADYQTKVLIGKTSAAVGEDVDCGGYIADDFDDLRFAAADETTLLDYWIESIVDSGGTKLATVWVQNNAAPNTTLYMYYGGTETAVSNGANTFIQLENFEWGVDTDPLSNDGGSVDWTNPYDTPQIDTAQYYGGTRSGLFYHNGVTAAHASFPQTAGATYAIRFRLRKDGTALLWIIHGNGTKSITFEIDTTENIEYYDTDYRDTLSDVTVNTWELFEFTDINFTAGTYDIWFNGVKIKDNAGMQARATESNVLYLMNNVAGSVWWDDIIIRKWAATEPSFAFGDEEEINPEITNTPDNYGFGILAVGTTSATTISYFTLNNTGSCAVDVTIQGTDLVGDDTLFESFYDSNAGDHFAGVQWNAQTFTPSVTHNITSVQLHLYRVGSPGTITVSIRATDVDGKPTGGDLCSGTTNGDTLPTGSPYEWREITLGGGYNLAASTKYAIVARALAGDSSNWVLWRRADGELATYSGGCYVSSGTSGSSWALQPDEDLAFEEYEECMWTLSDTATPGENIYGLYAGLDDDDDLFDVIVRESATYNTLVSGLAEDATQAWGLNLSMPDSLSGYDGNNMTATITLIASAA